MPFLKNWLQQRLKSDSDGGRYGQINMATLYEDNVRKLLDEKKRKLEALKQDPSASKREMKELEEEITILTMLYENYNIGMGAFRRVKGARGH